MILVTLYLSCKKVRIEQARSLPAAERRASELLRAAGNGRRRRISKGELCDLVGARERAVFADDWNGGWMPADDHATITAL